MRRAAARGGRPGPLRRKRDELEERLAALGWKITVYPVGWRFFYANGHRAKRKN